MNRQRKRSETIESLLDEWDDLFEAGKSPDIDSFIQSRASHLSATDKKRLRDVLERLIEANEIVRANEGTDTEESEKLDTQFGSDDEPVSGYKLIKRIGVGGFGEVWGARGPGGIPVAMKIVQLGARAGESEKQSVALLRKLRHPHVVSTHGAWVRNGKLFIAMSLADGTLESLREKGPIKRAKLLRYMREAAEGIDYLNGIDGGPSVQHRDIKPANLLLVGDSVQIADFGIARILEHTQASHSGAMTPAYSPPEFFMGKTAAQSDQYSLAVTYCYLRGGRLPFSGTALQIMKGHCERQPDLSMLPEAEHQAVQRALAKDPEQRWENCLAFAQALTRPPKPPELVQTKRWSGDFTDQSRSVASDPRRSRGVDEISQTVAVRATPRKTQKRPNIQRSLFWLMLVCSPTALLAVWAAQGFETEIEESGIRPEALVDSLRENPIALQEEPLNSATEAAANLAEAEEEEALEPTIAPTQSIQQWVAQYRNDSRSDWLEVADQPNASKLTNWRLRKTWFNSHWLINPKMTVVTMGDFGGHTYLLSPMPVRSFEMEFEIRADNAKGAIVFIDEDVPNYQTWVHLNDRDPSHFARMKPSDNQRSPQYKKKDWNRVELRMQDSKLSVRLNGADWFTRRFEDPSEHEGHVALMCYGGTMSFRNFGFTADEESSRRLCPRAPLIFYDHPEGGERFKSTLLKVDHRRGELFGWKLWTDTYASEIGRRWDLGTGRTTSVLDFSGASEEVSFLLGSVAIQEDKPKFVVWKNQAGIEPNRSDVYQFSDPIGSNGIRRWKDYSASGISLSASDGELRVFGWDADGGLVSLMSIATELASNAAAVAFSEGSHSIAIARGNEFAIWDGKGGFLNTRTFDHPITDIELAPDGQSGFAYVKAGDAPDSGKIVEFAIDSDEVPVQRCNGLPNAIRGIYLTPDAKFIAFTVTEGVRAGLYLVDTSTWEILGRYPDAVSNPVFSLDSRLMWYGVNPQQTAVQAVRLPQL